MRSLHLCFHLHRPYELKDSSSWQKGYFGGEVEFKAEDKANYQPLFALLERNAQRYPNFRASLLVSGIWLEQAERWDMDLIRRLQKLVKSGSVSFIATPYHYSMAGFYDLDELSEQIAEYRKIVDRLFGIESKILALPKLCYHNRLARWAEKNGFEAMFAGDAAEILDWRTVNQVYEAKGRKNLKLLFDNRRLSEMIEFAQPEATVQVDDEVTVDELDEDIELSTSVDSATDFVRAMSEVNSQPKSQTGARTKKVTQFSARKFQKYLDLDFLRGDLVNLYLDSSIFGQWRSLSIIGFFDELFKIWSEMPGSRLVNADMTLKMSPTAELSIKRTVSTKDVSAQDYQIPAWWDHVEETNSDKLYNLRKDILLSKDRDLYREFSRLTAVEYARGGENFEAIWQDIDKKLSELIVKDESGGHFVRRGALTESTTVKIKFDHQAREARERSAEVYQQLKQATGVVDDPDQPLWSAEDFDDMEAAIQVMAQRAKRASQEQERDLDNLAEAEIVIEDEVEFMDVTDETESENGMPEENFSDLEDADIEVGNDEDVDDSTAEASVRSEISVDAVEENAEDQAAEISQEPEVTKRAHVAKDTSRPEQKPEANIKESRSVNQTSHSRLKKPKKLFKKIVIE